MDILEVIQNFCSEKQIDYSLGCGSLLGAVRHKGYIPWDDDIDIYILRKDYDKLICQFPKVFNNISIASIEREPLWEKPYAKAYNNQTIFNEGAYKIPIGVNIDIFPIDKVPSSTLSWILFNKIRKVLHRLYESKYEQFKKDRKLYRNIVLLMCKLLVLPFSAKKICFFFDWYIKRYNDTDSEYVFESCQGMLQKNRFEIKNMFSFIDLPFEDRFFKGMKDYDEYLKNGFGDYMKLPPIEKRVSHHIINAWWK